MRRSFPPVGLRSIVASSPGPTLALLLLSACGGESPAPFPSEPPVPASLEAFDERVVAEIRTACERVRESPREAEAWASLGIVYEVESVRSLALVCYDRALALEPTHAPWWYRSAVVQWRLGDLRDAIERIGRAIELVPDYAPSYYRLGTFHLELGELEPAWQAFERAVERDPDFAGGWVGRARVLLQRDEAQAAVEVLEGLRERDPSDRVVHRLLVTAYRQAGVEHELGAGGDEGEADLEVGVLWRDPWQAELRKHRRAPEMRRVTRLLRDGDPERAIAILERRRADEPDDPSTLLHLAEAYFRAGKIAKARSNYREYLEHEPDNIAARMGLARIHESQGLPHLAVQKLDEILAIQPTFGAAYAFKARLLHQAEQYEMSVPVIEKALEYDQRNPELWLWLGHGCIALDRWQEAESAFASVVEQEPENGDAWLGLAKARVKLRELDAAAQALERARELGVTTPGALKQVDEALESAREREDARQERRARRG